MYKMAILSKIKLPFYNIPIERTIKRLKNIDPLVELPFYEQFSITKTDQAFKGHAISYKVEIIEKKDPIVQLEGCKFSIKNLFSDLLNVLNIKLMRKFY